MSRGRANNDPSSLARGTVVVVIVALRILRSSRPIGLGMLMLDGGGERDAILIFPAPFVDSDLENDGVESEARRIPRRWRGDVAGRSSSSSRSSASTLLASSTRRNDRDRDEMAGCGGGTMMPTPSPRRDDDGPPAPTATGLDGVDGDESRPRGRSTISASLSTTVPPTVVREFISFIPTTGAIM